MTMRNLLIALLAPFSLLSCSTTAPKGATPVTDFEVERYLGKWYEIKRLDHRFERGMSHVTANYELNDDGTIKVTNRGYKTAEGEWSEAEGKAKFVGSEDLGQLKVSFFGPFYGAYNIIELAPDYSFAMVVGPDTKYLWILSRTPQLDPEITADLLDKANMLGFDIDAIVNVDQDNPPEEE